MPDWNIFNTDLNPEWRWTTRAVWTTFQADTWSDVFISSRPRLYDNYYDKYTFKKGQKIVCKIDDSINSFVNTGYGIEQYNVSKLIKNKVYTVRNITFCSCGKERVTLEDIVNEQEDAYFRCSCGSNYYSLDFDIEWFEKYTIKGYEDYTTEQLKSYEFQKDLLTEFPERYKDIEPYLIPQIKEEFKELVEMF